MADPAPGAEPSAAGPELPAAGAESAAAGAGPSAADKPADAPKKKKKYQKLEPVHYEQIMQEDMMNNCAVKSTISGVMGGAMGIAFGVFMSSLENAGGGIEGLAVEENRPTRVVIREMLKNMRSRSVSYAKGFATMGFLYSGAECVVEKYRAKHDKLNSVYAGCIAGGIMAHGAGPQGMAIGCATFAAFSAAIEHFMEAD
jgi:import inner membrane translocase subunit TIM22